MASRRPLDRPTGRRGESPVELPEHVTAAWLRSLRTKLRRWHQRHGRDLPWRKADAYRVWISEIMLQQTTVAAVIPYFERFLQAFPTVQALASAPQDQVLRQWEGLGYYSRARNLHAAAQQIVREHAGLLPADVAALQRLPGIGRYTAGAIASFAFDLPAPIVEANTLRLYSRLLDFDGDPRSAAGQGLLWNFATVVLPRTSTGDFNQALTDLGATVCTPESPRCADCPLMTLCGAFRSGRVDQIPRPARRIAFTDSTECAVIVARRGKYLLRRCLSGERWAGLWDFPRFAVAFDAGKGGSASDAAPSIPLHLRREAEDAVRQLTGYTITAESRLGRMRHGVTRYRITLECLTGRLVDGQRPMPSDDVRWFTPREIASLPLSTTGRQMVRRWIDDVANRAADD